MSHYYNYGNQCAYYIRRVSSMTLLYDDLGVNRQSYHDSKARLKAWIDKGKPGPRELICVNFNTGTYERQVIDEPLPGSDDGPHMPLKPIKRKEDKK
jgi:hypothetical protein